MSIAADSHFRSVRLAFTNNDARGNEIIQLFSRILGGDWQLARSFSVAGDEQVTSWDTALPVASYDLAARYVNGTVPATGYLGSPDEWTSPHAPGSKTTLETTSAGVTWVSGTFLGDAVPVSLMWTSVQQGVPFLLEKSTDSGMTWSNVAVDLVAQSYQYTVPPEEINTTVKFRVTAQRAAVVGPTAGVLDVLMMVVVGQPTITTSTFSDATAQVTLAWSAASGALQYVAEKSTDNGITWTTIATVSALTYLYSILAPEANTTVKFRVTGKNGAIFGLASPVVSVACTMTIGIITMSTIDPRACGIDFEFRFQGVFVTFTAASGATVSQQVEYSYNGAVYVTNTVGISTTSDSACSPQPRGTPGTYSARARGVGSGGIFGLWSTPISTVIT